jgi:hypothetical protein
MSDVVVFWVACDDYVSGPFKTEETAQRRLDEIERSGACTLPHRIETGSRRPRTRFARY